MIIYKTIFVLLGEDCCEEEEYPSLIPLQLKQLQQLELGSWSWRWCTQPPHHDWSWSVNRRRLCCCCGFKRRRWKKWWNALMSILLWRRWRKSIVVEMRCMMK
jgi:hypothetical protein